MVPKFHFALTNCSLHQQCPCKNTNFYVWIFPKRGYCRFVINVPGDDGEDNYVQAVKVEKCIRQGESCNIASSGYETTVCRYTH